MNKNNKQDAKPATEPPVENGGSRITAEDWKAAEAVTSPSHKYRHRTAGNIGYDLFVYPTFAFLGVGVIGLIGSYQAKYGKNPHFDWLRNTNAYLEKKFEGFFSKFMKYETQEQKKNVGAWAEGTANFISLGVPAWIPTPIIRWMEGNRQANAARIDNMLGTTPPPDDLIEKEVSQTWKSVFAGRMFSWAISYAAFVAMGPKLTSKISNAVGTFARDAWLWMRPSTSPATAKKWADLGAFDFTFTAITATITYLFSRYIARKEMRGQDSEDVMMTIDPATPTPFDPIESPESKQEHELQAKIKPSAEKSKKPLAVETASRDIKPREKLAVPSELHTAKVQAEDKAAAFSLGA